MIKVIMAAFVAILPQKLKHIIFKVAYGYDISKTAYIGFSIITVKHLKLGPNARIGHLNVFKGLECLTLEEHASIGNLNWVTGFPVGLESNHFKGCEARTPLLYIGKHSAVTNRHLIDCTASFRIGSFSTFAGFRSQVLTHSINLKESKQDASSIEIGDYCFIGTSCVLLPGSALPSYSVLSANSLLSKSQCEELTLYGGNPAVKIKSLLMEDFKYFSRTKGFIE